MSAIAAYNGKVVVGSSSVMAHVQGWSGSAERDLEDTTSLGNQAKTSHPTLYGMSFDLTCFYDSGDTAGQVALEAAYWAATAVTLKLYLDSTHFYTGSAYVKSIKPKVDVGSVSKQDFSLQYTGAVTPPSYA